MALNADFSARVVIGTRVAPWIASREPGVERRLLDRVGDEVALAYLEEAAGWLPTASPDPGLPLSKHAPGVMP